VRFCWIFVGRLAGPPSPPYLVHPRSRQCFQAFCNTFHVQSCCDFFLRQFPKRLAQGTRPVQNNFPQTASLFAGRDRGSLQILGLELASEASPMESEPQVCLPGLLRNFLRQRNGPRGSRIGHHRLRSSRYTHSPWSQTHRLNPEARGFRNPRQLSTFTDSRAEP
jgi:hypothetical protein